MRIGLVGCVKSKGIKPARAQDLYISTLFKGRRRYVESSCDRWFVLSAKHGLVNPLEVIEPYDVALNQQTIPYRYKWSQKVLQQLQSELGEISGLTFEFHAGSAYRNSGLVEGLITQGGTVEVPTGDFRFGELLAFYTSGAHPSERVSETKGILSTSRQGRGRPLSNYDAIGTFLETSDSNEITLTFDQIELLLGRELPNSALKYGVWWANSATNPQSRGWVALGWKVHRIKVEDRFVRYRRKNSTSSAIRGALLDMPKSPITRHETSPPISNSETFDAKPIVDAMLEYGTALKNEGKSRGIFFTPDSKANKFLLEEPFAFLIGVIFDQGITAERAWAAPYELSKRLGHLDPHRMSSDRDGIRAAIQQRPKLHRFVNNLPEWVALAAEKVVRDYRGEASNIWNDNPSARTLQHRLLAFKGIGQKKAAMAVELLEKDFAVEIRDLEGSDVAFDVHVRRVFLRTGLGNIDQLDNIIEDARQHHPARPGSLDGPAWDIGRRWCRPNYPTCSECVLALVCPRFISRGDNVKGV